MVAAKTYNPYKVFGTEGATKLDIVDILSELRQERDRLEQAIRRLEALSNKKAGTRRRGHRVMSAAARAKMRRQREGDGRQCGKRREEPRQKRAELDDDRKRDPTKENVLTAKNTK